MRTKQEQNKAIGIIIIFVYSLLI